MSQTEIIIIFILGAVVVGLLFIEPKIKGGSKPAGKKDAKKPSGGHKH